MKLLVTGAFGNVGTSLRRELAGRGHDVTWFDVPTARRRLLARRAGMRVHWGDIRDADAVTAAADGADVVVHLAAVIPPGSDRDPALAEAVNVGGTENVIRACAAQARPPRIVHASSLALFGKTQHLPPPRTPADPIRPTDPYTHHKARAEELLLASGLEVAILRFGAVIPLAVLGTLDPIMFEVPLTDRIEFVHTWDVALALANAIEHDEVWGRVFLIGGGERCQIYQRELVSKPLDALGIGMLPDHAFGTTPFHTDWLDTTESQALLAYQRHTYDDFVGHMLDLMAWRRPFIRASRPIARWWLLRMSPYYRSSSGPASRDNTSA